MYVKFMGAVKGKRHLPEGQLYSPYVGGAFCCTQLMYYTQGAAKVIAKRLSEDLKVRTKWGYDISIKRAKNEGLVTLFASVPALGQHIGIHSSIGSHSHITHWGFEENEGGHFKYDPKTLRILYDENETSTLQHRRESTKQLTWYTARRTGPHFQPSS